jgi:hypothetical protein
MYERRYTRKPRYLLWIKLSGALVVLRFPTPLVTRHSFCTISRFPFLNCFKNLTLMTTG